MRDILQTDTAALELRAVTKIYPPTGTGPQGGIRDVSLDLEPGTFLTLLGPSGCGKTTTLRCIAGLEMPDEGVIRIGDAPVYDGARGLAVAANRRNIGMVFQSYAIWPHMTVAENVAFPLTVARGDRPARSEIRAAVDRALAVVSLDGFADRPATRLSGGQQQRVALARAIVRAPSLLLLDEPLSNLDAALRDEMRVELRRMTRSIGLTTVYVTHDQGEALEMSDRVAVMKSGVIEQVASPRDLYFAPATPFVAGFVGSTNWIEGRLVDETTIRTPEGLLHGRLRGKAAADAAVRLAVRPEAITLRAPDAAPQPGTNRLAGTVLDAGFSGQSVRHSVEVGDLRLSVLSPSRTGFGPGDGVALDMPVDDCAIFA